MIFKLDQNYSGTGGKNGLKAVLLGSCIAGFLLAGPLAPAMAQDETLPAANGGITVLPAPDQPVPALPAAEEPVAAPANPAESEPVADSALPGGFDGMERAPGLSLPEGAGLGPVTGSGVAVMDPLAKTPEEIKAEIREEAYEAAVTGLLPMRPEEIRRLLKTYDETLEAVETPLQPYPEPEIVVQNVALDPGVRPVEIKVAVGHVTTLNFVDVTGAPWPVEDVSWAGNFEVLRPAEGGWVLRITPMAEFAYGNMSVKLVELKTPVTFVLNTRRDAVHYRMDARIPEYGPQATPPIIDGGVTLAAGNGTLASVLDGIIPDGAEKMVVDGVDGRTTAYRYMGKMYVRTPLTLLSPAWSGSVNSADGMNVYTVDDAPVLLLSDKGRMVRASLSKKDEANDR